MAFKASLSPAKAADVVSSIIAAIINFFILRLLLKGLSFFIIIVFEVNEWLIFGITIGF